MTEYISMGSGVGGTNFGPQRDPFHVVKERVQDRIKQLSIDFTAWKEALNTTNTYTNPQFKPLTQNIKVALKAISADLRDLDQTIKIVEQNRDKFRDISDHELSQRKKFVNETKAYVQEVVSTLQSPRTKGKIERDQNEALTRPATELSTFGSGRGMQAEYEREAAAFIEEKRLQQQQLEEQQDVVLDDMAAALERLGVMSHDIQRELREQERELEALHGEVDEANTQMQIVLKKIHKLLGTSNNGKLCCILILFITAVALFIAVIS